MKRRVDEATSFILSRVQVKIGRGDKGVRGEIRGVRSFFLCMHLLRLRFHQSRDLYRKCVRKPHHHPVRCSSVGQAVPDIVTALMDQRFLLQH